MIKINENYLKLQASYLFAEIKNRTAAFQTAHPDRDVIKLVFVVVIRPLPRSTILPYPPLVRAGPEC